MSQVNLKIDIPDDVFEEAAISAIRTKVRQMVDNAFNERIGQIVGDTINTRVEAIVNNYTSYHRGSLDSRVREVLASMVANGAFEGECKKALFDFSQTYVKRVREEADAQLKSVCENVNETIQRAIGQAIAKQFGAPTRP